MPLLREAKDPVSGQSLAVSYYAVAGDSCTTPAGFVAPSVPLVCKITQADGSVTQFLYNSAGQLARILAPGTAATDFGYGANGRISTIRTPDAVDALVTGSFGGSGATANTDIAYDAADPPRVSAVTSPAPTPGATRLVTAFTYAASSTTVALPGGIGNRVVGFDAALRQTTDSDPTGAQSSATWRGFDQPATTTDPKGRVTTLTYDEGLDFVTQSHGPASPGTNGQLITTQPQLNAGWQITWVANDPTTNPNTVVLHRYLSSEGVLGTQAALPLFLPLVDHPATSEVRLSATGWINLSAGSGHRFRVRTESADPIAAQVLIDDRVCNCPRRTRLSVIAAGTGFVWRRPQR